MDADFFGQIYIEMEQRGDQAGWLNEEEINGRAFLAVIDLLKADIMESQSLDDLSDVLDGAIAAALQVGWEGAKRSRGD